MGKKDSKKTVHADTGPTKAVECQNKYHILKVRSNKPISVVSTILRFESVNS